MKTQKKFFYYLIITILLLNPIKPRMKCNTKLLDTFKLGGLKYSVSDGMHICPMVKERCCTLMDELSILKLWNSYARPKLRMYHEQLFLTFEKVVVVLEKVGEQLPVENILVNYLNNKWVPYRNHYCSSVGFDEIKDKPEQEVRRMNSIFPGEGKIEKFDYDPKDPIFLAQRSMVDAAGKNVYMGVLFKMMALEPLYYEYIKKIYNIEKNIKDLDLVKSVLSDINFGSLKDDFLDLQAKLRNKVKKSFNKMFKKYEFKLPVEQIAMVKNEFNQRYITFSNSIKFFMESYNEISEPFKRLDMMQNFEINLKDKASDFSNFVKHFKKRLDKMEVENEINGENEKEYDSLNLKMSTIKGKKYNKDRMRKKILGKLAIESQLFKQERKYDYENDLLGGTPLNDFEQDVKNYSYNTNPEEFLPIKKIQRKLVNLDGHKKKVKRELELELKKEKPDPKRILFFKKLIKKIKSGGEFLINIAKNLVKSFKFLNRKIRVKHMPPSFYKNKELITPLYPLEKDQIKCSTEARYMYKSIVSNNKDKMKFCYKIHQKMAGLDTNILRLKMASAKISNMAVLELKRTMYCSICDSTQQGNFNHKRQLVIFEDQFCRALIKEHESYLIFKNIILMEFINQVFQLAKCYETSGNEYDFPYKSILDQKKRRIKFFNRCFKNIDRPDFMMSCYFLCSDFKLMGYSKLWDGDLSMLKKILFELYKFASKNEISGLPPVAEYMEVIEKKVVRDHPTKHIKMGKGISTADKDENELTKRLAVYKSRLKYEINKTFDDTRPLPEQTTSIEKIPSAPSFTSDEYKKLCKGCEFGSSGIECRDKYCPPVNACTKCNFLKKGASIACRTKNCPSSKNITKAFSNKTLNLSNPRKLKTDEEKKIEKEEAPKSKYITAEELGYRDLRQINKPNNNKKRVLKKKIRILTETGESKKSTSMKNKRVLESNKVNGDEIYNRKKIPFNIPTYRTFYSKNIKGLNPLTMDAEINFESFESDKLLKLQYKKYKPEKLDRKVVANAMKVNKKILKAFKKDINLHFGTMFKRKRLTKKQKAKIKRKKFYKAISKSKILKMISKKKRRFKRPLMPTYSYMLNDVGNKSRDSASKVFLGALHNKMNDPEDPRDWDPFSEDRV